MVAMLGWGGDRLRCGAPTDTGSPTQPPPVGRSHRGWGLPTDGDSHGLDGTLVRPFQSTPQHSIVPSVLRAHVWNHPRRTAVY